MIKNKKTIILIAIIGSIFILIALFTHFNKRIILDCSPSSKIGEGFSGLSQLIYEYNYNGEKLLKYKSVSYTKANGIDIDKTLKKRNDYNTFNYAKWDRFFKVNNVYDEKDKVIYSTQVFDVEKFRKIHPRKDKKYNENKPNIRIIIDLDKSAKDYQKQLNKIGYKCNLK